MMPAIAVRTRSIFGERWDKQVLVKQNARNQQLVRK